MLLFGERMTKESLGAETCYRAETCYICLEECHETSPCECQATVHTTCLREYCSTSKHSHCTICQGPLRLTRSEHCVRCVCFVPVCVKMCIAALLYGCLAYVACGFLGMYVLNGLCKCVVYRASFIQTVLTTTFLGSSFVMFTSIMCIFCLGMSIRNRM